ncbi:helix-turn-helix domain-containing protein [Agromyces larvae]|uniref:Helix-turn-helix domain-containing protein n=1 Tax=Agromyces larvae TaxID=2929802 RepID=A0ABY4C3U6_9MICO|nr:helix-turn-helix domain-containing protein [Agromyces larvae]UOE45879.1 helix-turn-helix domain-containing protein [Agromyces larvae]
MRPIEFMTVAEVAALTKRHPETITDALRSGDLPGRQRVKGGRWIIKREDAEIWRWGEPFEAAA